MPSLFVLFLLHHHNLELVEWDFSAFRSKTLNTKNDSDQQKPIPKFSFKRQDPPRTPVFDLPASKQISTQSYYLPENNLPKYQQQQQQNQTKKPFLLSQSDPNVQQPRSARHVPRSQIARPAFSFKQNLPLKFDEEEVVNNDEGSGSPQMDAHISTFQESTFSTNGSQQPFSSFAPSSSRSGVVKLSTSNLDTFSSYPEDQDLPGKPPPRFIKFLPIETRSDPISSNHRRHPLRNPPSPRLLPFLEHRSSKSPPRRIRHDDQRRTDGLRLVRRVYEDDE